jgi:hypothetical protein
VYPTCAPPPIEPATLFGAEGQAVPVEDDHDGTVAPSGLRTVVGPEQCREPVELANEPRLLLALLALALSKQANRAPEQAMVPIEFE